MKPHEKQGCLGVLDALAVPKKPSHAILKQICVHLRLKKQPSHAPKNFVFSAFV
jgi:hypothetical protein